MADLGNLTSFLPSRGDISSFGTKAFNFITIFIMIVVVIVIAGYLLYIFFKRRAYKNKIVIWEKIQGRWEVTGRDRAVDLKYGQAGDTVFLLLKRKKYLPRGEIQTGRRVYWYAIREDGEWINIGMEDIDMAMKQAKAKFLHTEMRHSRTAIQRNLKERFDKPKFMEKYGHIIIPLAGFIIIALFFWLIMDKILTFQDKINSVVPALQKVLEKTEQILAATDRICAGSGIR